MTKKQFLQSYEDSKTYKSVYITTNTYSINKSTPLVIDINFTGGVYFYDSNPEKFSSKLVFDNYSLVDFDLVKKEMQAFYETHKNEYFRLKRNYKARIKRSNDVLKRKENEYKAKFSIEGEKTFYQGVEVHNSLIAQARIDILGDRKAQNICKKIGVKAAVYEEWNGYGYAVTGRAISGYDDVIKYLDYLVAKLPGNTPFEESEEYKNRMLKKAKEEKKAKKIQARIKAIESLWIGYKYSKFEVVAPMTDSEFKKYYIECEKKRDREEQLSEWRSQYDDVVGNEYNDSWSEIMNDKLTQEEFDSIMNPLREAKELKKKAKKL